MIALVIYIVAAAIPISGIGLGIAVIITNAVGKEVDRK